MYFVVQSNLLTHDDAQYATVVCIAVIAKYYVYRLSYPTLLETSLFTRVVYPQYMEQLIVWYFSSFSVNLHSLMFY